MLKPGRIRLFQLSANQCFLVCLVCGFLVSYYFPQNLQEIVENCPEVNQNVADMNFFEPHLNLQQKPMSPKRQAKNIIRPRYFSTELGIKEKLFIGIFTKQANIESFATGFNKTSAHLGNKIKFFIHAENVKTNFKLKNIVGFTDTREQYKIFHILNYINDNFLEDYDFFFLIDDSSYLNTKSLSEKLNHLSISFEIYMGTQNKDGHCDLSAGILFSSSVIRKIKANLENCVKSSNGDHHSANIGNCVKLATEVKECQRSWQGISIDSFNLNNYKVYRDLHILKDYPEFNSATVVYPVSGIEDFFLCHAFFSRLQLEAIKNKTRSLELEAQSISNGTIPNEILEVKWPLGVPNSNKPQSRHDLILWVHLNLTHSFMKDQETNVKVLSKIEADDIQKILDRILVEVGNNSPELIYKELQSAYRRFDSVRGMDYRLQILFEDKQTFKETLKHFEVMKPISLIEIIPSPYVTETTRIAMILPTFEHDIESTIDFVDRYEKICMMNQENIFMMLVLLYNPNSPNKGEQDRFYRLKNLALGLSEKYKNDNSRIAWVSIRLPPEFATHNVSDVMLSSVYGSNEILSLAVTDLALRKIGLESLIMLCSNTITFKTDFLNRVRMNTIQGFQIYSPIGFMMYPCKFTRLCRECESCDVSQSSGYFDRFNYDVTSFYSRDYVEARKKLETQLPIVRNDRDIVNLLNRKLLEVNTIPDMFVKSQNPVHLLRAVEPTLRLGQGISKYIEKYSEKTFPKCLHSEEKCVNLASRKQIGEMVIQSEDTPQS